MKLSRILSRASFVAALALAASAPPMGCSAAGPAGPAAAPALAPAAASSIHPPQAAAPPAARPRSHRYGVAAENATATRIAMEVLQKGGSAADAAIAGVLAIGVAQPVSSGLGGGGFALVWDAKTQSVTALDFRETAPKGLAPNDYMIRPTSDKKRGALTGVPGEVAGLAELHARWGKLAFSELVRGAADAAEKGFPLSAHMARALQWSEKWVLKTPRFSAFAPLGKLASASAVIQVPALAATLRRIGAEGKSAFYEGVIAADVLATARRAGSRMTEADLKGYRVKERRALQTSWEGHDVFAMPPPCAGGVMLLQALHMHSRGDLSALGYGSGAYAHLLAETFRGAIADRIRSIGDPAFFKMDIPALVSRERMKARRAQISLDATRPAESYAVTEAGTSHLVAADGEGNLVTITSTINNMFGAKLVTSSGFLLNDQLDDFTRRDIERRFDAKARPNSPRGGARPVSSMNPVIVVRDGRPILALGGSGGMRIATGTTQVFFAHLVFGRPVAQAVGDPRIDTPPTGGLWLDTGAPPDLAQDLVKRGEVVDSSKPNFSAVQAISIREVDGIRIIEAGADPRKGGEAMVD